MSEIKVNSVKGVGASTAAITINNSDGTCDANLTAISGGQLTHRNMMINGAMEVSQKLSYETDRAKVTNAGAGDFYGVDMFVLRNNTGNLKQTQSTDVPDGFHYALRVDVESSGTPTANHYNLIQGSIEGYDIIRTGFGTTGAKTLTLSWYVKSNLTGTFTGAIINGSQNRSYAFDYTINSANTWERKTITFPGDTTGTWHKDNQMGMRLNWALAIGSTYLTSTATTWQADEHMGTTNGQNVLASTDNYWSITGVQLEVGSIATTFEHKPWCDEFKRCCRYYQKTRQYGQPNQEAPQSWNTPEGTLSSNKRANFYDTHCFYPNGSMRVNPSITFVGSNGSINHFRFEIPGVRNNELNMGAQTLTVNLDGVFFRLAPGSGTPDDTGYRTGSGNAFCRATFFVNAEL